MFRERDRQLELWGVADLLGPAKRARVERSWAGTFREEILPLIDERAFAPMYHARSGRPNKPVEVVLGVLLLKEVFDLTDAGALAELEFNLLWQHALCLEPNDAHCCQKTLHNFRAGMMEHDLGRLAFEQLCGKLIERLGLTFSRQRLDSTHVVSNMAKLRRLGLFCETIRVFLRDVERFHPALVGQVSESLWRRYRQPDGTPSAYGDARSSEVRRRLDVCARDLYRLIDRFRGTAVARRKTYQQLMRLFQEQCEPILDDASADSNADDADEVPVAVKPVEPSEISGASLQSPHDPDATYSGHKGVGYSAQVAETVHEDNPVEIITHVELTDACTSDARAAVPTLAALGARDLQPEELLADTTYASASNAVEAARKGTELVGPTGGRARPSPTDEGDAAESANAEQPLTGADFEVDLRAHQPAPTRCPAGHACADEMEDQSTDTLRVFMDKELCASCPLALRCPAKYDPEADAHRATIDLRQANLIERRRAEADGSFATRYRDRSGSERTNAELKRAHGFGRLRVRGRPRVALALHLKAAACNIKRAIQQIMAPACKRRPAIE